MAALGKVREAFIVKARGGTDECGLSWQPLSPKTIAYSRRHPGVPKPSVRAAFSPSWMLTEKQRARWWALYRAFSGTAPQGAAFHAPGASRGWAAARAWIQLRAEGAKTLMSEYGETKVDILRDAGLLLNSLSPGVQSGNQIFRVNPGEIIIGTNRKWAAAHHNGIPGKLPKRRLWPDPKQWTSQWWKGILETARDGLTELTLWLIQRRS